MNNIILNFSNCKHIGEIHQIIKKGFDLPDYYGENLDALWDCLDYYCTDKLTVHIIGFYLVAEELSGYMKKILSIFQRVTENSPNITFEILS